MLPNNKIKQINIWENQLTQTLDKLKKNNVDVDSLINHLKENTFNNSIDLNNYVGHIWFDKIEINIFPKIFNNISGKEANYKLFTNIKYWYFYAQNNDKNKKTFLNHHGIAEINNKLSNYSIVDWFLAHYVRQVFDVFNKQVYHQYNLVKKDTLFIKGKIDFDEYFKNKISKGYFFKFKSSFFEYTHKNLFNQIVKKCLKIILLKLDKSYNDTNKLIQELLWYLQDVNDTNVSKKDCDLIHFYNVPFEFENILQMSKVILQNSYFNNYGKFTGFSLLLNMYDVFEKFVQKQLKEMNIEVREKKSYILGEWENTQNNFNNLSLQNITSLNLWMEPDIVIVQDKINIIADCKYKKINKLSDIKKRDIYQLIAYSYNLLSTPYKNTEFINQDKVANSVILLYPLWENETHNTFPQKLIINDKRKTNIHILKVPFLCNVETGEPDNILEFINNINNIFKSVKKIYS